MLLSHCHHHSERKGTSSWRCLDPKIDFSLLMLFDQQKSASSINFYSHLQELQIVPQSCFWRGAETSNSRGAGGWGFNKYHRVPRHEVRQSLHFGVSFLDKAGSLFATCSGMQREKADAQFAGSAGNLPLPLAAVGFH